MDLSQAQLRSFVGRGESEFLEFKRDWFDLSAAEGKAKLAKAILALSNTARPQAPAYLVFGIDETPTGLHVCGVSSVPEPETVSSILSQYILPPAAVRCRHYEFEHRTVSLLTVEWSPARPHHSTREYPGVLSSNVVYVRRDKITGIATLPEIESMIRDKEARLGPSFSRELLRCGFVQRADSIRSTDVVARITNVTTEPVTGIDVFCDVRHARNPELFERVRRLTNAILGPGESREVVLPLRDVRFYLTVFDPESGKRHWHPMSLGNHAGDRWLDVTLYVYYRDREGFIRSSIDRVAVDC